MAQCACGNTATIELRIKPHPKAELDGKSLGDQPVMVPACRNHVVDRCKLGTVLETIPLTLTPDQRKLG